jgi:hypothetical protein
VRFLLATAAAFLMLRLAADFCLLLGMITSMSFEELNGALVSFGLIFG